jgi:hypothetical protein
VKAFSPEVADIFKIYGDEYKKKYHLPNKHLKVIRDITACRTSILGGHVDSCDNCGHKRISYNSCRNRHCPKCQFIKKEQWVDKLSRELLPIPYFHIVFTIPRELNKIALRNHKAFYAIMFKASAETLKIISRDKKHLGAEIGFISVLHTWGQNLSFHPHVHCIVMGGGLSPNKKKWIGNNKDYFLPVQVLSRLFRGKFLFYLKQAMEDNKFGNNCNLNLVVNVLYRKEWIVNAKSPFKSPESVIKYLGRYTHRIAISNRRIISVKNGKVSFTWKDYRDNQTKIMTVDAFEFIRRFLQHVLPKGFIKIRYYGLLANRCRNTNIKLCGRLLNYIFSEKSKDDNEKTWQELLLQFTGFDIDACPACGIGRMKIKEYLPTMPNPPPL